MPTIYKKLARDKKTLTRSNATPTSTDALLSAKDTALRARWRTKKATARKESGLLWAPMYSSIAFIRQTPV